ncbi:ATPase, Ca++ transporting, plasma membrane 1, isoform CRA_d [Rattus norvegicus]|uniref:ATPase, Ca++ transporting, plasma membrane 1, isoform CRA_d n=1 Tax=Rattus norvegicus TaxID=10116 RepID=A6IG78_RAT|nr:ATPase, Ca++ transporting, plasma membrane 1, isoform CRA_d [Rattus norvegicus]
MTQENLRKLLHVICVDVTTSCTPKCPSLRQLNFRALCFFSVYLLPLFASCLDPLESGIVSGRRSRQINNPQADTKFTRTTISKKTKNKQKQKQKNKKKKKTLT